MASEAPPRVWALPGSVTAGEPVWTDDGEWSPSRSDDLLSGERVEYLRADLPAIRSWLAEQGLAVVPTSGPDYRLLRSGEPIQSGDQALADDCQSWRGPSGWEVGLAYNPAFFVPFRRAIGDLT